jgi:hypothetical protein
VLDVFGSAASMVADTVYRTRRPVSPVTGSVAHPRRRSPSRHRTCSMRRAGTERMSGHSFNHEDLVILES